jgi:class 3 adenylate cyclase
MRTENLAIVFIDIAGFTPRTSAQTREENQRMLRRFEGVVCPIVRAFSGRVVKTMGDAFLLTFRSPTDALLCSMAIHDQLAEGDAEIDPSERFTVRAAVNVGDVCVRGGDIFGEAVNIAARIEGKAGAGEIYFSESAFLTMTRTEVPSVEVGYADLKGIPDKVRLYRVPRARDAVAGYLQKKRGKSGITPVTLPFGGRGLDRVRGNPWVRVSLRVIAPAREFAQSLVLSLLHRARTLVSPGLSWWRVELRRSRAVQVGSVVVLFALIVLIVLMVGALKPKPTTPWQKLHRALGL